MYNKRLDKGILDFTVSADSDETVRACVIDSHSLYYETIYNEFQIQDTCTQQQHVTNLFVWFPFPPF